MLQHLRFHRRGPSNPTSPIPENSPWDAASLQPAQLVPDDGVPTPEIRPRDSTCVSFARAHSQPPEPNSRQQQHHHQQQQYQHAPSLPPIARVVSADSEQPIDPRDSEPKPSDEAKPLPRSPYNAQSGFIGGLALQNYRREQIAMKPVSSDRTSVNKPDNQEFRSNSSMPSPPTRPSPPVRPGHAASSFVSPIDLHHAPVTGKRPPGARLTSDPEGLSSPPGNHDPPAPRGRKSLPFLRNSMSTLLLRRKTSQNIPELTLPLRNPPDVAPYDPRIRGTRVHDFSAPRPRRVFSSNDPASLGGDKASQDNVSPVPDSSLTPVIEAPPIPPKNEHANSVRTSSTSSKTVSCDNIFGQKSQDVTRAESSILGKGTPDGQRPKSSIPPSLASLSRNVSEASNRDILSSLPKHMKSTSSRFSFDMIGAAKQEKLLEERHRQRQQDKKAEEPTGHRDSRFDDFDDDGFDYDAMEYDDGLEERIPGVNADLDDEENIGTVDDPDNDQENFAGFVFQRSGPTSSLASPLSAGILPTPRDVDGNVIGYAMTGGTPELDRQSLSSLEDLSEHFSVKLPEQDAPTGLGIQGLEVPFDDIETSASDEPKPQVDVPRPVDKNDELYFNDGLIHDFDGEGDGSAFDESIFDLEDTDRYGRPIPGMFANALSQRTAVEEEKKRDSDVTSRLSAHSGSSQSTAHTSVSVEARSGPAESPRPQDVSNRDDETVQDDELQAPNQSLPAEDENNMAAYQAALAAAAHQAAASGKFRRDSSPSPPPLPAELTITSPTTSGSSHTPSYPDMNDELDDYELDDGFSAGLDDYELDDDAIIAEANASALANDSDGWYGQEFGFYSAPAPQVHHSSNAPPDLLSEKNLSQYSHGGYFVPSGVSRTISGRVVSREPNLTPITERSEYSNRNSLMSLGMPPGPSSAGALQSPGLAQLAMMADDDNMSLSALLRLRSRAWGGSQASLVSSRDASPNDRNGASSPWGPEVGGVAYTHGRKNSAFSIYSQDSAVSAGAASGSGSPTLTMSIPSVPNNSIPPLNIPANSISKQISSPVAVPIFSPLQPSSACPPVFEDEETSPGDFRMKSPRPFSENISPTAGLPSQNRQGMGHRHRGSADSISYTKEEDSGETRWILERRRTAESGEIEILGREVVGNGRI
ncbi:Uu.00g065380.m01.CDS01 [Anthostomella pinea]|uniref:Uu.00g065380.m01.CDS01 n=1 Tax=Anthostomella pinea TaxID=933095 RepID=A0AAI8VTS0_9PEZI|nr:Uu.00g065380.m01.CDS01 [Anthostomella pinea]